MQVRTGTAKSGELDIFYEDMGDPNDPAVLLIMGLGAQLLLWRKEFCEKLVNQGLRVIRFDNRDVGLSSKLDGQEYSVLDMATDALAVLDAVGVEKAHVMGFSMGGMITQRLAIHHPERMLTMTSVMSSTGERGYGEASPEAMAVLTAKPARSREEYIDNHVKAIGVYGSEPSMVEEEDVRARAAAAYDRCFCPTGIARQLAAILADEPRTEALRSVTLPALVIHGSRDRLVDPSGGRRTAEAIPGARYVEIDGMGHDYPPAVWDRLVSEWIGFVSETAG